jgi:hypothetical protein
MKVQINNKQPRLLRTCTGRQLMPGKKVIEIEEGELQTILADATFKGWQKLAWVAIVQDKAPSQPEKKEEDLSNALEELNVEEAKDMIAACADAETLAAWHEADKRKGVKEACEERIAELENPDPV